jgi:phospholipase C
MPSPIEHVVVLMLENRSFDCMLGKLKPASAAFRGLTGTETNPQAGPGLPPVPVWNRPGTDPATMSIPDPDPGELFATDMNAQLFGPGQPTSGIPPMDGFVLNYLGQGGVTASNANAVMHYFTPDQVPVISQLATAFGVSDCWHASAPCQTWPNRFFVHTGTAGGYVNNTPTHFPYTMKSVFELLDDKSLSWRIYFHDAPQSATLANIWESGPLNFRLFEAEFVAHAMTGDLPTYSFIEPRYFSSTLFQLIPNDEHPPHNVHYGEQLIATVYNALRGGPNWHKTLLVITYDEHGGCYDHVPPPSAAPPGGPTPNGFAFDRYGVRVPAIIVSPYMPPGSVVRPPQASPYPFDHTSIIATLRKLFDLGGPLTGRDAVAPDLLDALRFEGPLNDGPQTITPPGGAPTAEEVAAAVQAPPNSLQRSLCSLAAHLPAGSAVVAGHLSALQQGIVTPVAPAFDTVERAAAYVEARVKSFIGKI